MRLFACLIVAPQRGYDEPATLSYAISSFCPTSADGLHLDPITREVLQAWIEKDVSMWRAKAMLGHPPNWRLNMIARPRSAGRPLGGLDLRYAAGAGL